ncbi:MAG: amidohydrolase family protein [Planctomycetales bacterium]|nr:amidohydrolase family protein [Planctomycetales bacterium]
MASAAGAGALALASSSLAPLTTKAAPEVKDLEVGTVNDYPWIDAHSHIWTHDIEKYPLANDFTVKSLSPLFTEKELLAVAHSNGVGRVVLIHHHPFHGWDNSYLIDVTAKYPETFRVVGIVDNLADNPWSKMRAMLKQHVTGFRVTSDIHKEQWLAGGMDEMWKTAADTGQNICCLINPHEIPQIDAMCKRLPDTPVVIDHFARVGVDGEIRDADVEALCGLARYPRTSLKISAYYALGKKKPPYLDLVPMIRRVFDAYGPERLMWASDSPYQLGGDNTYEASIALVRDHLDFLSEEDRQWLLRKTAERVFFYA